MDFPEALKAALQERDPEWFAQGYQEAVKRIRDHTADLVTPYFCAPTKDYDTYKDPGPMIFDAFGEASSVDDTRRHAFELLVLADLAPLAPEPAADPTTGERSS